MRTRTSIIIVALLAAMAAIMAWWWMGDRESPANATRQRSVPTQALEPRSHPLEALPGEALMYAYGSEETAPLQDLVAIHRVIIGYFSIIKDQQHAPIGGNEDLAAVLRGDNSGRQAFLPEDHPAFGPDGRLVDRWGSPIFVHPLAAKDIELRSAGPDREMFTEDDLMLGGSGKPN